MTTTWLSGARVHDLHPAIGNGPFTTLLGVVLHVNVDESGTPDSFWGNGNPGQVCPNFQVFKDGSISQMLPFDWQPWCQVDGNFNYAAIETAGLPTEPLTDAQCASIARILAVYHAEHGMPLAVANTPRQQGFGIHSMGGQAWGGHSCPGDLRAGQRQQILDLAQGNGELIMDAQVQAQFDAIQKHLSSIDGRLTALFGVDTTGDGKPDVTGTVQGAVLTALHTVLNPGALAAQIAAKMPPGSANFAAIEAAVKAAIDGATIQVGS